MNAVSPRHLIFLLVASAGIGVAGAAVADAAVPPAPAGFQLNGDAERGKAVFAKHCALCHGALGDGKSKMAESLKPKPVDFTDKALVDTRSDWELYLAARDGGPAIGLSKTMFGWRGLIPDREIRDAVAYVRSLGQPDSANDPKQ
jgi:mono/diheme cytochrome c family protein